MKAITQIIAYLRVRGELTREDLQGLANQGFLPWEEVFEEVGPPETTGVAETPRAGLDPLAPESASERGSRRIRGGRRGRTVVHKGPVIHAPELCARLTGRFGGWRAELDGLCRIGGRLSPCRSWQEAAVLVRNHLPEEVFRAVRDGIERRDPALSTLLAAIDMDRYREVVDVPGLHGPAVAAYRAIIASPNLASLGKHAWLLRRREVRHVFNLRAAQQRLGLAWLLVREERPGLFARSTRRGRPLEG